MSTALTYFATHAADSWLYIDYLNTAKNDVPTPIQVEKAMQCRVYSEDGRNIEFGHVVRGNWGGPTIVIFVRHMWCGLCQEFLRSLRRVDEKCYKSAGVEIIVVGCGDPSLIRRYKGGCAACLPLSPPMSSS